MSKFVRPVHLLPCDLYKCDCLYRNVIILYDTEHMYTSFTSGGDLTVFYLLGSGQVRLKGEVVFAKRPRIDKLASHLLGAEGVEFVSDHHQVRQWIQVHRPVEVPVDGADVQWQGGQVTLTDERLAKMRGDISGLGEEDAVATHFSDNVLPEDDNFVRVELQATRVTGKFGARHSLGKLLSERGGELGSWKNVGRFWVGRTWYEHKTRRFDQLRIFGNHFSKGSQMLLEHSSMLTTVWGRQEVAHQDEASRRDGGIAGKELAQVFHYKWPVQPDVRDQDKHRVVPQFMFQLLQLGVSLGARIEGSAEEVSTTEVGSASLRGLRRGKPHCRDMEDAVLVPTFDEYETIFGKESMMELGLAQIQLNHPSGILK